MADNKILLTYLEMCAIMEVWIEKSMVHLSLVTVRNGTEVV